MTRTDAPRTGRRAKDSWPGLARLVSRVLVEGRVDEVVVGRMLMAIEGALVGVTAPLLRPHESGWITLGIVSVAMTVFLAASLIVPWAKLSRKATVASPILTIVALGVIGAADPGRFAPLTGYLTLTFVYIGLTQSARTGLCLLPLGGTSLILAWGSLTPAIVIRLVIAISVWALLSAVLAWLTAQHISLGDALRRAAFHDVLTGLPNRRDLDSALAATTPADMIAICDIDHFKLINDQIGHDAGDAVLADFGAVVRSALRAQDYGARLGGEEFVLILRDTTPAAAHPALARLRAQWHLLRPDVTFSAGLAPCRDDRSPTATLKAADLALYAAKEAGRNTERYEDGSREGSGASRSGHVRVDALTIVDQVAGS